MPIAAYLLLIGPPHSIWACPVDHQPVVIGREGGCRVRLAHPLVSRRHCEIWSVEDKIHIRDLKSRNGTYVNGSPVHQRRLKFGDLLQVGPMVLQLIRPLKVDETLFAVEDEEEPTPSPTAAVPAMPTLSAVQQDVVRLLAEGLSEKEVAARLNLGQHSVHSHVKSIYQRLGISSRAELASWYFRGTLSDRP